MLGRLKPGYDVFIPVKKGQQRFYKRYDAPEDGIVIGEVRPFEPLKAFFSKARQVVAEGFQDTAPSAGKPCCIVGVKACDLKGFKVQDFVFKDHDYQDPFYLAARADNLIISSDCTCAIETCFCLALGIKPYPQEDFDINLSQISGGFVVLSGSTKGEDLIKNNPDLFKAPPGGADRQVEDVRMRVSKEVDKNIRDNNIPHQDALKGAMERQYKSDIWEDEAKTCVECGACNTICPTCHCFLLYDQKDAGRMERFRIWDSCLVKDFAKVAGGANPRPKLWMRLRNRFEKKFDFFPKVAGVYACTGCGRCISACPAKIDIRKVLRRLAGNA